MSEQERLIFDPHGDYLRGVVDAVNYYLSDSLPGPTELRMSHVMKISNGRLNPRDVYESLLISPTPKAPHDE